MIDISNIFANTDAYETNIINHNDIDIIKICDEKIDSKDKLRCFIKK